MWESCACSVTRLGLKVLMALLSVQKGTTLEKGQRARCLPVMYNGGTWPELLAVVTWNQALIPSWTLGGPGTLALITFAGIVTPKSQVGLAISDSTGNIIKLQALKHQARHCQRRRQLPVLALKEIPEFYRSRALICKPITLEKI